MNAITIQCKILGIFSIFSSYIVFSTKKISYPGNLSIIDLSCCYLNYIVAFLLLLFGFYCIIYNPKSHSCES